MIYLEIEMILQVLIIMWANKLVL